MTIKELYIWGKRELERLAVAEPEASAQFLLREATRLSKTEYLTSLNEKVGPGAERKYKKYIKRRQGHEPVWQIVGKVDFWGLSFFVNKNVLVPRPETEFLIQEALKIVSNFDFPRQPDGQGVSSETTISQKPKTKRASKTKNENILKILDVGTGSGTISITLAHELPNAKVWATDISTMALVVAKKNAKAHKVLKKIKFLKSDLLKSKALKGQKFNIVTANLPYISTEDLGGLAMDVHHYEPRLALDGGKGGLVLYKEFLSQVKDHLEPMAYILCEIGAGQGDEFKKLVKEFLPEANCIIKKDFGSFDRLAIISF